MIPNHNFLITGCDTDAINFCKQDFGQFDMEEFEVNLNPMIIYQKKEEE